MSPPADSNGLLDILCDIVLSLSHVAQKSRHEAIPTWFKHKWLSALLCSDADTIILLLFMAIPSMITITSLNDQSGCSSFHISAFVDGQSCYTYSDSMSKCSSLRLQILCLLG